MTCILFLLDSSGLHHDKPDNQLINMQTTSYFSCIYRKWTGPVQVGPSMGRLKWMELVVGYYNWAIIVPELLFLSFQT